MSGIPVKVGELIPKIGQQLPGSWAAEEAAGGDVDHLFQPRIGGSDTSWTGGTVCITQTDDGLAPQGETRHIRKYDAKGDPRGSGLILPDQPFTAPVEQGDKFGLIKKRYPKQQILSQMNEAFRDIKLPQYNYDTILTSGVLTYVLPVGVTQDTLLQVHYERDETYNSWLRLYEYEIVDEEIQLALYPADARILRMTFWKNHDSMYADLDEIDSRIHADMIMWMTARRVIEWRYQRFFAAPQRETNALNDAIRRENDSMAKHRVRLPQKTPVLSRTARVATGRRLPYPDPG